MSAIVASRARHAALARRRARPRFDHGVPIRRIDSLPILLFLFALVATFLAISRPAPQVLLIGLPTRAPPALRSELPQDIPVLHIGIDPDGTATFNGVRVVPDQLALLLDAAAYFEWTPGVIFEPHPRARYADALPVLGAISKARLAHTRFCFGGLKRNRHFGKEWRYTPMRLTLLPPPDLPPAIERPPEPGECDPVKLAPPPLT